MAKFILVLAFFLLATQKLKAQNQDQRFLMEEYLIQSEKQKKTGITMIIAGLGTAGIGLLIAASSDWDSSGFASGGILFLAGSASTILGVPIIVSSAATARKAARLSVQADSSRLIYSDGSSVGIYPTLNLTIPLNSRKR